ncbi:MAG: hypothetical protein MUC49_22515 [Raineya sp.]|jgi:hypothetical protein|nr:hypothetical protein [Raineya sp.]
MRKSIFEFGDILSYQSPFNDWITELQEQRNQRKLTKIKDSFDQNYLPSYKRLIIYGGSIQDDELFGRVANNIARDYEDVVAIKIHITAGGQNIVDKINSYGLAEIQSIDFIFHGSDQKLYIKLDANRNSQDLYINDVLEQSEGVISNKSDKNTFGADIGEINFRVFTNDAKIEIHGCNAASITSENSGKNFASEFSRQLFENGKTRSVVIGHVDYANPNRHTTLKGDDYRHGVRRIYHGGKVLFRTKNEGRIKATIINKYLNKKELEGRNYDGSKEKTW